MAGANANSAMLAGCRVLDFTQYLAGPTVTRLMAEMGADIIKVELAPMGDPSRLLPTIKNGRSGYFVQQNRGKKSLCLDFSKPESLEILRALVPKVDIVVENFGPGVMQKRGLDYDSLKQDQSAPHNGFALGLRAQESALAQDRLRHDRAGFLRHDAHDGRPGRSSHFRRNRCRRRGNRSTYFRRTRICTVQSREDRCRPVHRHRDDRRAVPHARFRPAEPFHHRWRSSSPNGWADITTRFVPAGVYKGPQGWIFILVLDRQWANMAKAMGRPELRDDPRFATGADRVKNRDVLNPIVEQWLASMPSDDAAVAALEENRVACAPVLSVIDTMKHPYFKARNMVRKVRDPILGEVTIPGFPLKFSAYPGSAGHPGSPFGRAWRTGTQGSAGLLGRPNCEAEGGRNPLQRESLARTLAKKIPLSDFLPQN